MKRVAGYARVSTGMQVSEGTSLEEQKRKIKQCCDREDWKLTQIYEDGGISGGNLDRPALKQLMEDARAKKFEVLLFTKLDRLGRSNRDVANLYHELVEELKIDVISTADPSLNTSGPMGKALVGLMSIFAEFERSMIKTRTTEGRRIKWEKGEQIIGELPFGYKKSKAPGQLIEIDEERADVYRKIVDYYLIQRLPTREIAKQLTSDGITSPSGSKGKKGATTKWEHTMIAKMLKNAAYKGEVVVNKKVTITVKAGRYGQYQCAGKEDKPQDQWIKVNFPPLISPERWQQIQDRRENQKLKPKRVFKEYDQHFMLDGFIRCGECGSPMQKRVKVEKSGKVRFYYRCFYRGVAKQDLEGSNKHPCSLKAVDSELVDSEVFGKVSDILTRPDKYVDAWFKDLDTDEIEKKIVLLTAKEKELDRQLKVGFDIIRGTTNKETRKLYVAEQDKTQAQKEETNLELTNARKSLAMASGKINRFEKFKEMIGGSSSKWKTVAGLQGFLASLPFKDKKVIVEAMISPENGGRCTVSYITPNDFFDDEQLKDMTLEERLAPLKDERCCVTSEFNIDVDKITGVITGLNRDGLISETHSS